MARNLNPPRTAFHRRLQGMTLELESGFVQVNSGFNALHQRLETDLKVMNDHLGKLTVAVKDIPKTPGVVQQILQVNVLVLLGDTHWKMIAVNADEPLRHAIEQMHKNEVDTMLVTERQRIAGMITRSQIMTAILDNSLDTPLKQCMITRKNFYCISHGDSVAKALRQFQSHPVKRLFVIDTKGGVIGILTLGYLMRWLAERLLAHTTLGT